MSNETKHDPSGDHQLQQHPEYKLIMAPAPWPQDDRKIVPGLLLLGTIQRGHDDWRTNMARELRPFPVTILNPDRPDWGRDWRQDITCEPFRQQVYWELDMIERSDLVAVYFASSTEAPVTMLELGLIARKAHGNVKVYCAEGYKSRGNVQVVCEKYNLELVDSPSALGHAVQRRLREWEEQTGAALAERNR